MQEQIEAEKITGEVCAYVAGALDRALPAEVVIKAKHHLLDTLAAMVSGSRLGPGKMAIKYIRSLGGRREALVVGTRLQTTAINAALANGMLAHADETDDSHLLSRSHPGCAVVPAALAMAEREGRDGEALLRAVVLGYDVGSRFNIALNMKEVKTVYFCTHSHGPGFGAAAAAAALAGATAGETRDVFAFAAQQASGLRIYMRDQDHIEKAFDFGGMPARNGVTSATMVRTGFTGVLDAIGGPYGYLDSFADDPRPEALIDGLGSRFEILDTNIKKWSVGSPIQAALDSLEVMMAAQSFGAGDVESLIVRLPDDRAHIVDDRDMSDINLQHLLAVMLLDGGLSFASSHDHTRMGDPAVRDLKARITLVPEAFLTRARPERQAIVEITLRDGRCVEHRTHTVRGTPENPMEEDEVDAKALDILAPVLGGERAQALVAAVRSLETLDSARDLRPLLIG